MTLRTRIVTRCSALLLTAGLATAHASIESFYHEYQHDNVIFQGYVAHNAALERSRGTVLIVHDWDGPNAYEEFRAQQLAGFSRVNG